MFSRRAIRDLDDVQVDRDLFDVWFVMTAMVGDNGWFLRHEGIVFLDVYVRRSEILPHT